MNKNIKAIAVSGSAVNPPHLGHKKMLEEENMDKPVIESLLDTDFYKFTMGQFVFNRYPNIQVVYALRNRTKGVNLADYIHEDELKDNLRHVQNLRFNNSDLHYLRGTNEYGERMFTEPYLEHLKNMRLPDFRVEMRDGELLVKVDGPWATAIYWEIPILAVVNELYYRGRTSWLSRFEKEVARAEGIRRLSEKINALRDRPGLSFTDFGTRRRFSRKWQECVVRILAEEMPRQFFGTSNTYLAMKFGLLPMGTSAHELFMVAAGKAGDLDNDVLRSHNEILRQWWEEFGWGLSIALTDTFGTDFFFRDMTVEQAVLWKGLRQDSGDPIVFGEKAIKFYEARGVDPKDKLIVFSDGLDVPSMIKIYDHFLGRIKVTFGWGTNLTNDIGFAPLSLVVKAVEANGFGLVKLSDNLAKAIGAAKEVERYKKIFGYAEHGYQECRY